MARSIHKLSALAVSKANKPGARLSDGGNLYLRISMAGVKSWSFMYSIKTSGDQEGARGRQREIGLGPLHTITLAEARIKATELRKMLIEGDDPMASRLQRRLDKARTITFKTAAETYISKHKTDWKNDKSADQWQSSLDLYANPIMGRFAVASIDTALVLKCLVPIWETKTETATRVRGRIEKILDWCTFEKYRTGENPARWKGHLEQALGKPSKLKNVKHHPALPYAEVGAFVKVLRAREEKSARMLELAILTATRSGEVRGAPWSEIDLGKAIWVIPKERMKMEKEHRVPLSSSAVTLLKNAREAIEGEVKPTDLVFPGPKPGKPFSDAAMSALLERMGRSDITGHGFRSTFRDWASECTAYSREVCEMALAHGISDAVEAAYRRGDLFEKRTRLMDEWAEYCSKEATLAGVTPIRGAA